MHEGIRDCIDMTNISSSSEGGGGDHTPETNILKTRIDVDSFIMRWHNEQQQQQKWSEKDTICIFKQANRLF